MIQGNLVGTDLTGTVALGNSFDGIVVGTATGVTVGGSAPGAGNVVSANRWGIVITANGTVVQGNFVGTDAAGTAALGNTLDGIRVISGTGTFVGGPAPGAGNIVSGNVRDGISLGVAATVQGNLVGVAVDGSPLGNAESGIFVAGAFSAGTIGGTGPGEGNVVVGNGEDGIRIIGVTGLTMRGNSMSGNGSRRAARDSASTSSTRAAAAPATASIPTIPATATTAPTIARTGRH